MSIGTVENKVKVVLDTNILVSALVYGGTTETIFKLITSKTIEACISPILIAELLEVLFKKFQFSLEKLQEIERMVKEDFIIIYPRIELHLVADESDNRIIEAAIEGDCQIIVTGDKELLKLTRYKNIHIVSASDFISSIKSI